ncbi:PCNA-inhibitor [Pyrococcus sp. ST04]|uniref:PCNA-inhibitor n=1 Tax=Pyrococcus sp. ST04 TaxID=1183377 RepID=UPI0002605FE3|nr:PCNA-inhibitor [Pyrococcus sp. ST04]AFK22730.1 hypothetical protein Py04_1156 [Pyrococcus sp. ST04]
MDRKLDDFFELGPKKRNNNKSNNSDSKKSRKKLKSTNLDEFLPEEHINFFKNLRIGSKRIARKKIEEV